jgi:hypothetical protein
MDCPKLLALKVAQLSRQPQQIKAMSLRALEFAHQHTFEQTFQARISHMKRIAELPAIAVLEEMKEQAQVTRS